MAGDDGGRVAPHVTPAVGDADLPVVVARNARDAGARRPGMEGGEGGASRPMGERRRHQAPQTPRQLLGATDHHALVLILGGHDDAQNLQHGIGKIAVPAAGAKTDLAEDLTMAEGLAGEAGGGGDEIVKGPLVPERHQPVPDLLQCRDVTAAYGRLQGGKVGPGFERFRPGLRHFAQQRRKSALARALHIELLAFEIDQRRWRRGIQGIGKGLGLNPDLLNVMVKPGGRGREAHAAEFGNNAIGAAEGF